MLNKELIEYQNYLTTLGYCTTRTKDYPRAVEKLFEFLKKEKNITHTAMKSYVEHLKQRNLKPSYINTQISAIKTFGKFLSKTSSLKFPSSQLIYCKHNTKTIQVLTTDQIKKLYAVTDASFYGFRDKAMLSICYGGGLRRNEAISLSVQDIDTKRAYIHVRNAKNHKQRIVPLPLMAVDILKEYIKQRNNYLNPNSKTIKLFVGYGSKAISSQTLEKQIKKLALLTKDAQIIEKNITLHLLRHSIATHLLNNGVDIVELSDFLGHNSLISTQVYTHIKQENENNF